ncbi:CCA tRNA nucleotidyltransferase [Acidaminococcus massiliensis]|uniref:CCA tRNA nucleotidyltransferase n=1 Tax=Acidaminococcus massiliensis TaxID=1852375 RepID=UPI0026DA83FB|nr:HD domain-containing protein [Acidaminococcus massiliensis]
MKLSIPPYVKKVMDVLLDQGFEAYVVGGAVRDMLLGRVPDDYDVVTNARPEEIKEAAAAAKIPVVSELGQNFGVVILRVDRHGVEVAAYRNETYGKEDVHRPAQVWYCDTLEEDLGRRDFTINALAVDQYGHITDCFNGLDDLRGEILRTVGNADQRFSEDALRMFRACRFVAQLGFVPDAGILPAIGHNLEKVRGLSLERVRTELNKLLMGTYAGEGMELMVKSGLAAESCRVRNKGKYETVPILPELGHLVGLPQNPQFHPYDVWKHTAVALDKGDRSLEVGWGILLHDVAKGLEGVRGINREGQLCDHGHEVVGASLARKILARLRLPRETVDRVAWLVQNHMHFGFISAQEDDKTWRWLRKEARSGHFRVNKEMAEAFKQLTAVCVADVAATNAGQNDVIHAQMYGKRLVKMAYLMPVHTSDLDFSGREALALGASSRQLRDLMPVLLHRVQDRTLRNDPEELAEAARRWLKRQICVNGNE